MTKNWCAYTDIGYMPRFVALYESMRQHCGDFRLYTMTFDDAAFDALDGLPFIEAIPSWNVLTPDIYAIRGTRKFNEWIWSTTPRWIQFLLFEAGLEEVYYVDGDCFFYDYPGPLYYECMHQEIAISPHRFPLRLQWREKANGKFNVGIEYFKRSQVVSECLMRWHKQAVEWCYHDSPGDGRCAEQGYLDDWPERYGAHIIDHLGVDLAPWNQEAYNYEWRDGNLWVEGIFPVIVYHFHGWSIERDSDYTLNQLLVEHIYGPYRKSVLGADKWYSDGHS